MIAVQGGLDCGFDGTRVEFSWLGEDEGQPTSEFSWLGEDEGQPTGGRGWAKLEADETLRGRLYFHQGDDTEFVAKREDAPRPAKKAATRRPVRRGPR
jgi:hypothetical protein